MGPYIFVIATILAILPILIIFKVSMERIKEDPAQAEKAQINFIIGTALSEIIPIILVVYGFANIEPVTNIKELYMPGIIVLLTIGVSIFFMLLQRVIDVDEEIKNVIQIFTMIGIAFASSLPIMSIVAFFMMVP